MKILILTLLAFSNFSFSHEMTLKSVKADRKKAEIEEKKLCSKRDVICKRGLYKQVGSKRNWTQSKAEKSAQNRWFNACRKSKEPSILSTNKEVDALSLRINSLRNNSILGQEFIALDKEVKNLNLSRKTLKTKEDRQLYDSWSFARRQWIAIIHPLQQKRGEKWENLYSDNGVCGKNTRDPDVYRAYEKYQVTKSKCKKAEVACLLKGNEVMWSL